jgi:hypothetical protein
MNSPSEMSGTALIPKVILFVIHPPLADSTTRQYRHPCGVWTLFVRLTSRLANGAPSPKLVSVLLSPDSNTYSRTRGLRVGLSASHSAVIVLRIVLRPMAGCVSRLVLFFRGLARSCRHAGRSNAQGHRGISGPRRRRSVPVLRCPDQNREPATLSQRAGSSCTLPSCN